MNKKQFDARIKEFCGMVLRELDGARLEPVNDWCGTKLTNVFQYAMTSERCMEKNLAELKGCKRKTTYMHDLSIGEWCEGYKGVFMTVRNSMLERRDDVEYMAEFVLCVNWKSWEHYNRNNMNWSRFYSLLYEYVRDLMYDYYEGDEEKSSALFEYLD